MVKEYVTLVVDDRENEDVIEAVNRHPEVENWYIDRLEIGDIQCESADLLIERKTMEDYAGSLRSGHLADQLSRMREVSENCFILVEDDLDSSESLTHTQMRGESIRGSMASTMARKNTPVVPCSNVELLVDMSVRLSRKFIEDPGTAHLNISNLGEEEPTMKRMYTCLPDIGPERADRLYEEFPHIGQILAASAEQLTEVEGIGEKTAEKIMEEL